MYVFGDNSYGQLGTGRVSNRSVVQLTSVSSFDAVVPKQVAAGAQHSCFVSEIGDLFTWGANKYGQLGRTVTTTASGAAADGTNSPVPTSVRSALPRSLRNVAVQRVACGANFTAIVMSNGALLTCGDNTHGQQGHGDRRARPTFKQIEFAPPGEFVRSVVCGARHMIATFADGSLRACGDNSSGQLGIGSTDTLAVSLRRLDALWAVPIVQLACGIQHSVALGASGDVYVWGSNSVGM